MTTRSILRGGLLLALLPMATLPFGCSSGESAGGTATPGGPGSRAARITPVATAVVAPRDLSRSVTVTGPLEPIRSIPVNSQTTGSLVSVLVEEGSRIAAGQLLAELDARESNAQLSRARAVLANAEASYHRAERLEEREVVSESEIEVLRSAYEIARADVELWSTRVAFSRIVAPAAGVITAKRVEQGATVTSGQLLFEIAEDARLVVRVRVSELDVVHLDTGRRVDVQLDAYPGVRVPARIRRIFPSADPASRLVPVEVELDAAPPGVQARPGFLARVEFALDRREKVLAVPTQALGVVDRGAFVYVVASDTLSRRAIETGLTTEGWVEVTRGLASGEHVVVSGHVNLRSGATVRVTRSAAAESTGTLTEGEAR